MKEILLSEKEMMFFVLLYFHVTINHYQSIGQAKDQETMKVTP